ncbi:hypothetical protein DFH09DRAFT_1278029 [Mycena vulgaris]|nr:hypothetical protein DFH09DRAFT_1278029 [Mycena vulgaris]
MPILMEVTARTLPQSLTREMPSCPQDRSFGPASTCRDLDFTLFRADHPLLFSGCNIRRTRRASARLPELPDWESWASTLAYALLALKGGAALSVVANTIASLVYSRHLKALSTFWASLPQLCRQSLRFGSCVFPTFLITVEQFTLAAAAESPSRSPLYTQFSTTISGLLTIQWPSSVILFPIRERSPLVGSFVAEGQLALAFASLTSIAAQLSVLFMNLTGLENASVALSRIPEIASLPAEHDPTELSARKELPSDNSDSPDAPGCVEFQNVCFQYGSGKSSLILALFQAVDQSLLSGNIIVDGVDTWTLPLATLRDSMRYVEKIECSLVSQNPFIRHAPLRHNLDPHEACSDKDIWLTLERIGMSSAMSDLPNKLETV